MCEDITTNNTRNQQNLDTRKAARVPLPGTRTPGPAPRPPHARASSNSSFRGRPDAHRVHARGPSLRAARTRAPAASTTSRREREVWGAQVLRGGPRGGGGARRAVEDPGHLPNLGHRAETPPGPLQPSSPPPPRYCTSVPDPGPGESTFRFFRGPMAASAVRLASRCLICASSCCCIFVEKRKTRTVRSHAWLSLCYETNRGGCGSWETVKVETSLTFGFNGKLIPQSETRSKSRCAPLKAQRT